MGIYPGYDISDPTPQLVVDLGVVSNLRFCGFYLAHARGVRATTWMTMGNSTGPPHTEIGLWVTRDCGWHVVPLYVPMAGHEWPPVTHLTAAQRTAWAAAHGPVDGREAATLAARAHLERGATIYLDIETAIVHGIGDELANYVVTWSQAVQGNGYRAGAYISHSDAVDLDRLVTPHIPDVAFWPFAVLFSDRMVGPLRNQRVWNNMQGTTMTPVPAEQWNIGGVQWGTRASFFGCQHDQWNGGDQRMNGFSFQLSTFCQQAAGGVAVQPRFFPGNGVRPQPNPRNDIDWDTAKGPDPAHPRADLVATSTVDSAGTSRIFVVTPNALYTSSRARGAAWGPLTQRNTVDSAWPALAPGAQAGWDRQFEPGDAAAVSRQQDHFDVFAVGADGSVHTAWENPGSQYPNHPWTLNMAAPAGGAAGATLPARKGAPVVAVSAAADGLDMLYVTTTHRLVHRSWRQATNWANGILLPDRPPGAQECALVAPGSRAVVALADPVPPANTTRIHVVYIGFSFGRFVPGNDLNPWWNTFRVWHATGDMPNNGATTWSLEAVAEAGAGGGPATNATGAAATGLAATFASDHKLHVVVQEPNRRGLVHWIWDPTGPRWTHSALAFPPPARGVVPQIPPTDVRALALAALANGHLLLAAVDVERVVCWSVYDGRTWAAPSGWEPAAADPAFSAARPIRLCAAAGGGFDVVGVTDDRRAVVLPLTVAGAGFTRGVPVALPIPP